MARIRTIKPDFWRDEALASISPEAALLAIGLLNHSDDEGWFKFNPKLVEADVFPLRKLSKDTTVLLRELSSIGYIQAKKGSDGKEYGKVVNFERHQVINKKTPSKIKELCSLQEDSGSVTVVLPCGMEGKGNGNGKGMDILVEDKPSTIAECPHEKILDLWQEVLPEMPQHLRSQWNSARQQALRVRWRAVWTSETMQSEEEALDYWRRLFVFVRGSKFLMGKVTGANRKPFQITLEWLIKPANFSKVVEGKYHE